MAKRRTKIVVETNPCLPSLEEFRTEFPEADFRLAETPEQQIEKMRDAEVLIGHPCRQAVIDARKLRWIQSPVTGIDFVRSIPELVDSDIVVTNVPAVHAEALADHVFGMILTFAHHMRELWQAQKDRRWVREEFLGKIIELQDRTMGILALGHVGRAVAKRAGAFGMNVYGVDISRSPAPDGVKEVWPVERLDELLGISDWFVVTAPLTDQTEGMIDRRRVGLLKPGGYMIVISRGGIVDEQAVAQGLRSGRIAGAGLDAMAQEPPDMENPGPLWELDNVLLTPHTGGATAGVFPGRQQGCRENLRRYLAGEPLQWVCDKKTQC